MNDLYFTDKNKKSTAVGAHGDKWILPPRRQYTSPCRLQASLMRSAAGMCTTIRSSGTRWSSNAPVKNKKSTAVGAFLFLVETSGLEPLTPCMSSKYSNQLSYASVVFTECIIHYSPQFVKIKIQINEPLRSVSVFYIKPCFV